MKLINNLGDVFEKDVLLGYKYSGLIARGISDFPGTSFYQIY